MSRCFPFPPSGYEKKQRPEDLVLLKEVKHKEKKEKKDKDKKKDKEKKENDESEKQRDKKDRKEKHKDKKEKHGDKKKDKEDRGKDKEKSSISEESTVAGKLEERSGEKVHPEGHNKYSSVEDEGKCSTFFQGQNGKKPLQSILPSQATKEARFVQELDRRIRDDEKGRGNQFLQRVANAGKRDPEAAAGTALWNPSQVLAEERHNDGDKSFQGKKLESQGRNCDVIGKATAQNLTRVATSKRDPEAAADTALWNPSHVLAEEKHNDGDKSFQGKKLESQGHNGDSIGKATAQNLTRVATSKRDPEAAADTALRNPSQVLAEEKHNDGDKSFQGKKLESQGRNDGFIGKATVQNLTRVATSKNEGIPRPLEEHNESMLEDKEKYKETGGNKQGDKRKDRDKEKHRKEKRKEKEKKKEERKKEEKANANIENEKSEPGKSKISGRNDLAGAACNKSVNLLKDVVGTAINEGSIRKRKDTDTNGFLHESEIRPNKVQRLALHQSTENGRKLEVSSKSSDKHADPNNVRLDHHGQSNNGIIVAKKPSPSNPNPSGINIFSDQIVVPPKTPHPDFNNMNKAVKMPKMKDHTAEASRRPPHPDSKCLSQILTVPTVGDWPEDDDQEWLFSKKGPLNKPEFEPVGVKEDLHVWSESVHIESADVYALPYVIPY